MGILDSTFPSTSSLVEAEVMSVDVLRNCCEVRDLHNKKMTGVRWLHSSGGSGRGGDFNIPTVGDQVLITTGLSHPVILGYLPRVKEFEVGAVNLDVGFAIGDTGNLSYSHDGDSRYGPGKPEDAVAGDRIITSEGGGMIALLRMGTVMLRSSRLAQIILSKFDDLVRIVGRNYEVFSDVFVDVAHNLKGRIYRFVGYAETHAKTKSDTYTYQEHYGDTSLSEYALQNSPTTGFPIAGSTIRKIKVLSSGGSPVYTQTLDLNGHIVDTVVHSGTAFRDHDGGQIQDRVTNGSVSTVTLNGSSVVLDQGSGSSTVTLTNSGITLVHGSASVTINSSSVVCAFGAHSITVDGSGVHTA